MTKFILTKAWSVQYLEKIVLFSEILHAFGDKQVTKKH